MLTNEQVQQAIIDLVVSGNNSTTAAGLRELFSSAFPSYLNRLDGGTIYSLMKYAGGISPVDDNDLAPKSYVDESLGDITILTTWSNTKQYKEGDTVIFSRQMYLATADNINAQPGGPENVWTVQVIGYGPYDATTWNANTDAPTKTGVRSGIEGLRSDIVDLLGDYLVQGENDLTQDFYLRQPFKTQIDEYLRVGDIIDFVPDKADTKIHIVSDNTRNYGIYHFAAGGAGEVFYTRGDGTVNSKAGYWIDGQRVVVYEDSSSNFGLGLNSLQGISATSVLAIGNYAAYFNSLIENNSVVFSSSYKNYDLQGAYIGQGNLMPISLRNASVNSGSDQDASNGIFRLSPSRGRGAAPGGSVVIQKAIGQPSGSDLHTLDDWWVFGFDGQLKTKGDTVYTDADFGPVLKDRSTGSMYRIFINDGAIDIEPF